jgi:site-specific DNA-methyltransferase (adenine-specific)
MAVRIEDAGFEIRDMIAWVYGSGFPKSLDVSKAIDKAAGAERKTKRIAYSTNVMQQGIGVERPWMKAAAESGFHELAGDIPATEAAKQWQGWGTALKPALEPITVARKPLGEKTVAANVLAHGTGAINVDGCRVPGALEGDPNRFAKTDGGSFASFADAPVCRSEGRWPANLIHDGSDEVDSLLNSAARFFYCAKASKKDRDEGCEGMEAREKKTRNSYGDQSKFDCPDGASRQGDKGTSIARNFHPTVKPTALMRYLCRLVTPPEGIVLDPFMGSGSTGKAAITEGFEFIGIERDDTYFEIAKKRIEKAIANVVLDNDL